MDHSEYPVTVAVRRPDGTVEQVRVGTAVRDGDGFQLSLGELRIAATPERAPARQAAPVAARGGGGGMVFPNYGRSKGAPIHGASIQDLEYYAGGCRRTLQDPNKARWHDKERELLAAIEAELTRQGGGGGGGGGRGGYDDDGGGRRRGPEPAPAPAFDEFDAPPPSDDDLPF